ncbi:reverse transcriptase domain, reverse transcriptase zinc-binding domain protein, partial [Tanacetum coccineum]
VSYVTDMERGFLSQKEGGGGRGVKEKQQGSTNISTPATGDSANDTIKDTVMMSSDGDKLNKALGTNPDTSTPKVVNEVGENDVGTGRAISTPNPGKSSSYANVICKPSRTKDNFRTLFTPAGNDIDVVVPVESIRTISERFANTTYGFFLGKWVAYPVVANYVRNTWGKYGLVRSMFSSSTGLFSFQFSSMDGLDAMLENDPWSSYARPMIELRADVKLKDNIVVAMPKITREGFYTCNIHVKYEWKPPSCECCKVFGHVQEECPKNIDADETENLKKPSQTHKGVPLGTNGGTLNLASQEANSSGSAFWNVDSSSPTTTLIVEKIDKIEKLIIDGKVTLVDDEEKPLEKISLLEQWKESYENDDYEYDSYDDDMYEGQKIPDKLQSICDNLHIKVQGRKKK